MVQLSLILVLYTLSKDLEEASEWLYPIPYLIVLSYPCCFVAGRMDRKTKTELMNWMFYCLILFRIHSFCTSYDRRSTPTRCFWKTLFSCWAQRVWKQLNSPRRCSTSRSALPNWRPTLRTLLILSRAYKSSTSPICSANRSPYVERDSSISHTKMGWLHHWIDLVNLYII